MEENNWHSKEIDEVLRKFKTQKEGLTQQQTEKHRAEFGENVLPQEKPISSLSIFFAQFQSPLIYFLILAGIITLFLKDYTDTIVIFAAVLINSVVGFFQEYKASRALQALKKTLRVKAVVLRNGLEKQVYQEEIVPGDIILLRAGDKVPADGRLIKVNNLKVSEAVLTGESRTETKQIQTMPQETVLADRKNMVYMGTTVEDGSGRVVVTATGAGTQVGKIARLVKQIKEEKTPYQKKLAHLSRIVGLVIVVLSLLIFIGGILVRGNFIEMFTTAVAVAVAAIPEGLPVAMTVILALGMQRILKRRGLVRRLVSAESLGSTSVICADKTGTLTEGKMKIARIITVTEDMEHNGKKFSKDIELDGAASHLLALKIATLRSEAFIENPQDEIHQWIVRGRPTDKALLLAGIQVGLIKNELNKSYPEIDNLPFDPKNKYSASLHQQDHQNILFVLGAPEILLKMSSAIDLDGQSEKINPEKTNLLNKKYLSLANQGLRVLATAYKKTAQNKIEPSIFSDLIFVGFIGLHDPLRPDAKTAIVTCQEAGLRPIIVTGDHQLTARAVAQELGFKINQENILEGSDLNKISDQKLQQKVEKIQIYARVEPAQKLRIIQAWQAKNQVVAMTGDGINDTPALKKADIGVALGSGTEVAKEVSDLVLLDDNFSVIVAAVEEGRAIIDNIRKVITYLLSDSFTEVILISVSLLLGWPLPVLAAQILWVNLIEDGLPAIALAFESKEKDLMLQKPERPTGPLLSLEMKALVFSIGLITNLILLIMLWWFLKYSSYEIIHIRSVIFAGLATSSLLYVFACKSLRKNLWQINPFSNIYLNLSWLIGMGALVAALYLPFFQNLLKTISLNLFDWSLLIGASLINLILIEFTKWFFIKKTRKN